MVNFTCRVLLNYSLVIGVILILFSCKEILQDNLSDKTVIPIIPQNNYTTPQRTILFKWNKVDDANNYTIQIVSPSFTNITSFNVDSNVSENQSLFSLEPGDYEWRVKANNTGSSSEFTLPMKFTIDTSSDLSNQVVYLSSPNNNLETNQVNLTFSWQPINEAENYDFIIKQGSNWNSATIIQSFYDINANSQIINVLPEGEFIWGVRAKNSIPSLTTYSTFNLFIDTTKPQVVTLTSPTNGQTDQDSTLLNFTWNTPSDIGFYKSSLTQIVEFYSDSLVTLFDTIQSSNSNGTYTFNQTGTYFWRVYSRDNAGNLGDYSSSNKLIIQ